MAQTHLYNTTVEWTGNTGTGSSGYRSYERSYNLSSRLKPAIPGSSDPGFRGDGTCWNPEELLVGAISACHQLWFLHLCSMEGVAVQTYVDFAEGVMEANSDGSATFRSVTLRPEVTVAASIAKQLIDSLHKSAHAKCVIAQSVNFTVECKGVVIHSA